MLELKDVHKVYKVGDIETRALDGVSVSFRDKEFVAILGTSGSGKTTCLNIIGGLDRYDSGDLIIKGKSTKDFKAHDWDAYRNNTIGFVFQNYNLITHLSIVANVELGMTLSGVSKEEKHKKALEVLEQVGLKEHLHKKPNQLSGGQMQRVAIARALANDPEILLCDEPTGALDSTTSVQIMDLIKEVAKDRLVIMVTHNPELAKEYADRIIRFSDGKIIDDTNPYEENEKAQEFKLKKTSMGSLTALRLSFNNLMTKKGRTFLTSFASSIGIIGIAVILSLSTGFQSEIDNFQSDTMSEFPIMISQSTSEVDMDAMMEEHDTLSNRVYGTSEYADTDAVMITDSSDSVVVHKNDLSDTFIDYLESISSDICSSIGYVRVVNMNLIAKDEDDYGLAAFMDMSGDTSSMTSTSSMGLSCYPDRIDGSSYLEENYELVYGSYPKDETELVLVVDTKNQIDKAVLTRLGFVVDEEQTEIAFDKIVGTEYKLLGNNEYYAKTEFNSYLPRTDYQEMYESEEGTMLKIVGVVRAAQGTKLSMMATGIAYSDALAQRVIQEAEDSDIVKAQQESDTNVMTMEQFDSEESKETFLSYLGGDAKPYMVLVFPKNFEAKDEVISYIDAYNKGKSEEDVITYTDLAGTMSEMTSGIMDGITIVLIAFAAISLVVSMIMICIITYTSVIERTKEIGILKSLGARKKDITRVFDAETLMLGVFSGLLGVFIAWLCTFPINAIINDAAGLTGASHLQLSHALILVAISTVLTVLGGHIPARMASKKDAVEALRSE
jgi:putative ABC transport system permease protein